MLNGDVLMAETNAPPKVSHGFHAWAFNRLQPRAGGAVPSPDRIARLRDLDGDGIAETRRTVLLGVHSPFGMTLVDTVVFVATDDAILQFPFRTVMIGITGQKVCSRRSMGSARTSASAPTGTRARTASRTRPISRVELGRDLVPNYITAVHDGGLYGWPYSDCGTHLNSRVKPPQPLRVSSAIVPDYALRPHSASLGQHGSWDRQPRSGYKVIFVPFRDPRPAGPPVDVLPGFVNDDGTANGRPVGLVIDHNGARRLADDVGNTVWRVIGAPMRQ